MGCASEMRLYLPLGDLLLRLQPKVPVSTIFGMLEYAYQLQSFKLLRGSVRLDSLTDVLEQLAAILAKRVLDRARKGLYRSYVAQEETLPYLRGRLRLRETITTQLRGITRLACAFEEHTADLEENRLLAWTLCRMPRLTREAVRQQVAQAFRVLVSEVTVVPMTARDCVGRVYHRLNEDYRMLHALSRFFLEHCAPTSQIGDREFYPFLINMPRLFELFVAEWLKTHAPARLVVDAQQTMYLNAERTLSFVIDVVVRDRTSGKVIAVMDTKYKRAAQPDEDDVQQIIAYAHVMGAPRGVLIYPSDITTPTPSRCAA